MSFPTVLSPWFVVQRFNWGDETGHNGPPIDPHMEYYTSAEDDLSGPALFFNDPKRAMIFASLQQSTRVALSEGAHVRVLTSKEEADEFGRS